MKADPTSLSREELEAAYLLSARGGEPTSEPYKEKLEQAYKVEAKHAGMTSTKAWAAGGGGALGAALAEILILLLPRLEPAETAITIVLSALVGAAAAYWSPANKLKT